MVRNGKGCENHDFSSVAATFEKAITYVFAGSPFRNAEVRGSIPLCSTNNTHRFDVLPSLTFILVECGGRELDPFHSTNNRLSFQ